MTAKSQSFEFCQKALACREVEHFESLLIISESLYLNNFDLSCNACVKNISIMIFQPLIISQDHQVNLLIQFYDGHEVSFAYLLNFCLTKVHPVSKAFE